jgi:hypothetical protein
VRSQRVTRRIVAAAKERKKERMKKVMKIEMGIGHLDQGT